MPNNTFIYQVILKVALCLAASSHLAAAGDARLYRWTDENGHTYYSDKVPPQYKDYQRKNLDQSGITVSETKATRTPQEREQQQRLEELRNRTQRKIRAQQNADGLLLKSFRSEKEISQALASKHSMADFQIRIATSNMERLEHQRDSLLQRASLLEKRGKSVPNDLKARLDTTQKQLQTLQEVLDQNQAEKVRLSAEYEQKRLRFHALVEQLQRVQPLTEPADINRGTALAWLDCQLTDCDQAWLHAREYAIQHSTTPLEIDTSGLVTTSIPLRIEDLSLILARLTEDEDGNDQLFLDVRCHPSELGKELCTGEATRQLLEEFPAAVRQ